MYVKFPQISWEIYYEYDIKFGRFRSQLEVSRKSNDSEELRYNSLSVDNNIYIGLGIK